MAPETAGQALEAPEDQGDQTDRRGLGGMVVIEYIRPSDYHHGRRRMLVCDCIIVSSND